MIQAIETKYNGCLFRSRIEARWAVFYDALKIEWEYESQGFELGNGLRYLPDFWLPQQQCWVEIKGGKPSDDEISKAQLLAAFSGFSVYIFHGDIPYPHPDFNDDSDSAMSISPSYLEIWNELPYGDPDRQDEHLGLDKLTHTSILELLELSTQSDELRSQISEGNNMVNGRYIHRVESRVRVKHFLTCATKQLCDDIASHINLSGKPGWSISLSFGGGDCQYHWCECPSCGAFGIEFNGRSDRLPCKECYYCSRITEDGKWSENAGATWSNECPIHGANRKAGCKRISPNRDKGYTFDTPRLTAAYAAARTARFEHGQTPKVQRGKPRR